MIPTDRPASRAARESVATSTSSSSVSARITPAWWKSASAAASEPASAAVWSWRPAGRSTTCRSSAPGSACGGRRAARCGRSAAGSRTTRRRAGSTSVASSSSHHSSRSLDETSALLPIETNADMPRPRVTAASSSASPRAPLCDEKPMLPGGVDAGRERRVEARPATEIPRQLGPISRAPCARTSARSRSWRSIPSLPSPRSRPR